MLLVKHAKFDCLSCVVVFRGVVIGVVVSVVAVSVVAVSVVGYC